MAAPTNEGTQGRRTGSWLLPLLKLRIWAAGYRGEK